MKKILSLLLIFSTLVLLFSCGPKYKPVKSTKEEQTTVYTLTLDGEEYEVRYELYRAFFLNLRDTVDGGDRSVWQGENKQEYIDRIDAKILEYVTDIYAAFAVCKRIGFDVYSNDVDEKIEEYVVSGVEGGYALVPTWNGIITEIRIEGNGSYDAYLASLKAMNVNYSVQELLYRYYIALSAIDSYYIGTFSDDNIEESVEVGAFEYTRDDVLAFYNSDECVRLLRHFFLAEYATNPAQRAESERLSILDAALHGDDAVVTEIIGLGGITSISEVRNGIIVARYNLDEAYASELAEAAFNMSLGEVSEVIEISDGFEHSYNVFYRAEKSQEHFDADYASIAYAFLKNKVGKILDEAEGSLAGSIEMTDFIENLDRSAISME